MKNRLLIFALYSVFSLSGCATYKIFPVADDDKGKEGLRFYKPDPYLLVSSSSDDKGIIALKYEVIYLPDFARSYTVQRKGGMGTAEAAVELTNGWMLTKLGVKTDSQMPQTLEAISQLLPAVAGVGREAMNAKGNANTGMPKDPGLYKIEITTAGETTSVHLVKATLK